MRRCIARTERHIVSQSRRGSVLRAELSKRTTSESMDDYIQEERDRLAIQYALEIFRENDKVKRKAMLAEVPVSYQAIVKAHVDAWWRHR